MIRRECPYCVKSNPLSEYRSYVKKTGFFRRKSDCRKIQKFRCLICLRYFSRATGHPCFQQNKRQFNERLYRLHNSGVSMRRAAKLLGLSRTTVARKFQFLGDQSKKKLKEFNHKFPPSKIVEFDDLETFEHTKMKPLSITLAVENKSRRILGFRVSQMPAKGHLAKRAAKKYGPRKDLREQARNSLFEELKEFVDKEALIKSDENPHYPKTVKIYFPMATHERFRGTRGSIVGQGELKKVRFDPLFSLNHTCAMLRANINRLFRKTWCTTKIPERLTDHIAMYAEFHNSRLIDS